MSKRRARLLRRLRIRIETPPVSWLGGLPQFHRTTLLTMKSRQQRGLPIFHSVSPASRDSELQTVVRAEKFRLTVARRRRFFTVFPCAESLVIVDGAVKIPQTPLLAINSLVVAA